MLRRPTLVTVAIALVVMLTACTESARIPDAEPSSEGEPLFASDDEALAAATAAYEEYLAVLDAALASETDNEPMLSEVASGAALEDAEQTYASFVGEGFRLSGRRTLKTSILQQATPVDDGVEVQIYICESVQGVDVLNAEGVSQVDPERPTFTAFEVSVFFDGDVGRVLERTVWPGGGVCGE